MPRDNFSSLPKRGTNSVKVLRGPHRTFGRESAPDESTVRRPIVKLLEASCASTWQSIIKNFVKTIHGVQSKLSVHSSNILFLITECELSTQHSHLFHNQISRSFLAPLCDTFRPKELSDGYCVTFVWSRIILLKALESFNTKLLMWTCLVSHIRAQLFSASMYFFI